MNQNPNSTSTINDHDHFPSDTKIESSSFIQPFQSELSANYQSTKFTDDLIAFYKEISEIIITAEENGKIGRHKQWELFLKAYTDKLETLVAERTAELEAINQKLRQSEERFHMLLSNSPLVLYTQDTNLRYTWLINPKIGDPANLAIGKTDDDFLPPEIASRLTALKRKALDTGTIVREEVNISNDLNCIYSDLMIVPTFGAAGNVSGISCVAHDITERKLSEFKLRRLEDRFEKAFRCNPSMMCISRMDDSTIIDVNEAWLSALGYTREEVINQRCIDLGIIDQDFFENQRNDIIALGGLSSPEFHMRTKQGSVLTIVSSVQVIELDGEKCLLSSSINVTQQKKMQIEIARLDRLNLVGKMAAIIGHEIRNPMTAVRGFLQMFYNKAEYQADKVYFDLMIDELDRANSILSVYLGMAKDKTVDLQLCSLDSVVESIHPIVLSDAVRRDMNVKLHLDANTNVLADENELRQLIINIAYNGLDSMQPGGTLIIQSFCSDEHAVLSIKDHGCGLAKELIDNLGTPFLTTKANGTGLGLAVCFSIASRHNAAIDFDTSPQGTTCYIRFPLHKKDHPPEL